jgi:copper transport protein
VDRSAVSVTGTELSVPVDAQVSGTYRVVWSVISQDTHPELGTMTFSVRRPGGVIFAGATAGRPGGPFGGGAARWAAALGTLAHILHFAGFALAFGAFAAVWPNSPAPAGPAPAETPPALWRLTGAGIALMLIAEPLALAAESVAFGVIGGGGDAAVIGAVLDSSFGRVLFQRLAAAVLLWVLAGALRTRALGAAWTVPLLGAGLAFIDGEAAHATSVRPVWWGLTVNAAHLAGMGLWTGALAFFLVTRGAGPWRSPLVHRRVAAAAAVAVATGIVMAAQHLATVGDFTTTPYGRILAVKIGAVAVAGGLGWLGFRSRSPAGLRAREAAAMLVVLVLAAFLILLRPPVP